MTKNNSRRKFLQQIGATSLLMPVSSLSAFLRVALPMDEDDYFIDLNVPSSDGFEPIDSLQTLFDAVGGCSITTIKNNIYQLFSVFMWLCKYNYCTHYLCCSNYILFKRNSHH